MKNEGALPSVFQACRNLSVRCVITSFYPWAASAFRSGRCQGIGHAGKNMPCPSSAMSSGRLFLDRGGRHQSPSPLHRHGQNNTRPLSGPAKPDISTLQRIGHFYFALTGYADLVEMLLENGASLTIEDQQFHGTPPGWFGHGVHNCDEGAATILGLRGS